MTPDLTGDDRTGEARGVDVVVVGSVAGLQAALTLGRACRQVVVLDAGQPRNHPARFLHNYLGAARRSPAEFLAEARAQRCPYDVAVVPATVLAVERGADDRLTVVTDDDLPWTGRAVVLATGMSDELPDVPGVAELWVTDVIACPHCHAWEVRHRPLALLARPEAMQRSVERAVLLSRWSTDAALLSQDRTVTDEQRTVSSAANVEIVPGLVQQVAAGGGDVSVRLERRVLRVARVFVEVDQRHHCDLAWGAGCRPATPGDPPGPVCTDPSGRSTVPNVWIAGTAAHPAALAIGAAGHASTVAVAVHEHLTRIDTATSQHCHWPHR